MEKKNTMNNIYFDSAFWVSHPDLVKNQSSWGWIVHPQVSTPFVMAYKREFKVDKKKTIVIHVSADERYELFLDGKRIGRGPERGDPQNQFFESYELSLVAGEHILVARVWSLGYYAPVAQMSLQHGFILSSDDEHSKLLDTGVADWMVKRLAGYSFKGENCTGARIDTDGNSFCWGFESGKSGRWEKTVSLRQGATKEILGSSDYTGHYLRPSLLPAMLEQRIQSVHIRYIAEEKSPELKSVPIDIAACDQELLNEWENLLKIQKRSSPLNIPANRCLRVIIDMNDYYCAYPEIIVSSGTGSVIDINWAESLFTEFSENGSRKAKGNRDVVDGKYFIDFTESDTFRPDGGKLRRFNTLWWRSGRYIELIIKTGNEALLIDDFILTETRYPFNFESSFHSDDKKIEDDIIPVCFRTHQMCSHETYMDCPYYEQLLYTNDARIQALIQYVTSSDNSLSIKSLEMLHLSRQVSGLTLARYPSWKPQLISTFPLGWIGMLYDFASWNDNKDFVKKLLPTARNIIDTFALHINNNKLLSSLPGWNFVDWRPEWNKGVPPGGTEGELSSLINFQFINALKQVMDLENYAGEEELVRKNKRIINEITTAVDIAFWSKGRGMYSDDLEHKYFSEHTQSLAIIAECISDEKKNQIARNLQNRSDLTECSLYFLHFLFEACKLLSLEDVIFERIALWGNLKEQGFKTVYEEYEPSRSDCHAWASHPIYHIFTSIAGIRPGTMGFKSVDINPLFGKLHKINIEMPHNNGLIKMDLIREKETVSGKILLPKDIDGIFTYNDFSLSLNSGLNIIKQ
jgi:alpha-L-rhamnosidase